MRGRPRARLWTLVVAAVLGLLAPLAGSAQAAPVTVANGTQFTTTSGEVVHAHGGGVIKSGGYYYWFGENRNADNTFRYVSAYRSTDLKTWEFRRHVLTQATDPELASANIERPKVLYNERTRQYVMWMHKENGSDYSEARAAVATSATIDGDYTWRGSFRPLGQHMSRDLTLFQDGDGAGYMVSAARDNYDLHIYRLTDDYTGVASLVANPWPGGHREAPALFKRGNVYFMLTSGATGWNPNQQQYATATSLAGPWSAMRDVGDATAYGSQTAYVLPVQGSGTTSYLYLGDRWGNSFGGTVNDSRYVWLPLAFPTATTLTMDWYPQLTIDTAAGTVTGSGGPYTTLRARHSGKCADIVSGSQTDGTAAVQYTCNGGGNQLFWSKDVGGGQVQLVARHSSQCLTVAGGSTADGAAVVQSACGTGTNQQWRATDTGDGYVRLTARSSGKCLDVADESTADKAALLQWSCTGGANQQWRRG
ncbi:MULTISPECIES: RICIN domain-containing protein [unclassified Streptomyces]|uniref:RICIN domain-containing protein n=1 Tax=unclassified Streptomyces TaxID=2593676 RepID=UPI00168AC887|nr:MULTISPECIES: RICIN domain-containing protein [unclassified Streptomyces]MBD3003637.1 RICIN domain-containing protein [Streptomyces sp. 5-10]